MSTIFPGSASVGQVFDGYSFNGIAWDLIGNEFNPTSFSPTAPDNPKAGDLWVDSSSDVPSISPETILTVSSASSTYLTQTYASSTYLSQASASTNYATKAYADNSSSVAAAALVDAAPSTLNTLNELAAALGDDENFATTVTTSLGNKLDASSASITYLTQSSASTTYVNPSTTPISGFRNAVINGDFRVWQRGTSFTTGSGTYTADRWVYSFNGTGATRTVSQQSFTPGNTISGYEPQYHLRYAQSVAGTGGTYNVIGQRIEDARTFAGQTVTISFWAKAAASTTITTGFDRNYGTGGSSADDNTNIVSHSLTTSWQRFTTTVTIASVSGKTIGSNSLLLFWIGMPTNATFTIDIWGVQVESGSVATPFEQRPIGTELALCQRYYWQHSAQNYLPSILDGGTGNYPGAYVTHPVPMRTTPTTSFLNIGTFYYNNAGEASFTPSGGSAGYDGTNTSGKSSVGSISNPPGASHSQKFGQWNVRCTYSAEL